MVLRSRYVLALLVALPALLIAAGGLFHPIFLEPETAVRWRNAHLVLLPLFPLLALSVVVVLRGERGPASWGARVLAFSYAVLYGALDSIAGIGAPKQVLEAAAGGAERPPINDLFEIGDQLGALGVYSLAGAGVLTGLVLFLRTRSPLAVAGGAIVAVACYPFLDHHVFPPRGVLAVVAIGAGLALLELSRHHGAGTAAAPTEGVRARAGG